MRIGIISILHESNTFSNQITQWIDFEKDMLLRGEDIIAKMSAAHHELGGFLSGLKRCEAHAAVDVVPLFAARATPAGPICDRAFSRLSNTMLDCVQSAGRLDGILAGFHGAAVAQGQPDADGHWLSLLREQVGPTVNITCTLDLHANLSGQMVRACNAIVGYRTNPHLDQRARGQQAAGLIVDAISGTIRPTMSAALRPLVINIDRQCTDELPLKRVADFADRALSQPDLCSNSVLLGFPYADVLEMGAATVAVTDNADQAADHHALELSNRLWQMRDDLIGQLVGVEQALDMCCEQKHRTTCLLDMGDNVGGGSAGDGTTLARALLERRIGPSFLCLRDASAAAQCRQAGVGGQLQLTCGGKSDDLHGPPLELDATVRSLHDGRFRESKPRHGGITDFDQGETAVVDSDRGLTLMLTTNRMVPFSLQQLTCCGLDPASFRVLVAKGVNAPIAAYQSECQQFIRVNTIGSTCADLSKLTFANRRTPLFPFESDISADIFQLVRGHAA